MKKTSCLYKSWIACKNNQSNDEFFTPYDAVKNELDNYIGDLADRTVYCPADEEESAFWKYFKENFARHGLKKLIATKYVKNGQGILNVFDGAAQSTGRLSGDGDFRSGECADFFKEADVVVTNPPFSLMKDFLKIIKDKKYIIVAPNIILGHTTAMKMALAGNLNGGYTGKTVNITSHVSGKTAPCIFCTNMYNGSRDLPSTARFGYKKYYFFDRYPDILAVDKIKDIPVDYAGKLGVPLTYIKYHDPSKYRIIGFLENGHMATVNGERKF